MTPVLVVDDSLTVRMDLADAFVAAGMEPVLATDLASAREALSGRTFSLVVLDLLLPDGDGLDLLAEIKRSPRHAATPVVLLSTEAEVRHRILGLTTGADDYVGKPYDRAQVVARARRLVRSDVQGDGARRTRPVLVIDDSVTAREELRATLERGGIEVVTAASGEEGLRLAVEHAPGAVVVDAVLPGMDGAAFIRALRADPALRTTPCILLTGSVSMGEVVALDEGADAFVRKDAEGEEVVLARVRALLRGATAPAAPGAGEALAPKRLVAVGAESSALDALVDRLVRDGHDVVRAAGPGEALALLGVDRVDAILVEAPSFAGALDAARGVRADARSRDVALLLLGGREDQDAIVQAMNAGADDYVAVARGPELARARVDAQLRRRQYEDENRTREGYARSAQILETISDAFFAVDRDWRFVYVNHALERVLDAPRNALTGALLWDRCAWLAAEGPRAELSGARERQLPVTFETRSAAGQWWEVRAFPHRVGLSAYLRDVTQRRHAEEIQAHLLGIVGHDLRTPLTAIRASVGLVARDRALSDGHRRALQRAASASERMARLINDLLDYSRARLGRGIPISPRAADLDAICRGTIEDVLAAHGGRAIRYEPGEHGAGRWDPDRVAQILTNLLTNALRYSPESAAVTVAWRSEGDQKVLSVHNDGPPIERRLLDQLWEPFERGASPSSSTGGAGLGLFIVREIARAHGGSVEVRSEPGEGTTFSIVLPAEVRKPV